MTDEDIIKQYVLRLEHPEVDWSRREGENYEQAIARWRVELKTSPVNKRRRLRSAVSAFISNALGMAQVIAAIVLTLAAVGAGFAIIRALWRLAGRL